MSRGVLVIIWALSSASCYQSFELTGPGIGDAGVFPDGGPAICEVPDVRPMIRTVVAVDLLLVVDDSPSMREEQATLAMQLPRIITVLTSGDRDFDGGLDFPPVTDLHVGVITVNMGVAGVPNVPTCMRDADFGDDGILLTVPRVGGAGCMASYPHFLTFTVGMSPAAFAVDVTCLAQTGTGGCGFEQQLDAPLKALLPRGSAVTFAEGTHGHGDDPSTNLGFLRDNSLVVVLEITDEDDCSTSHTDIWNPASLDHSGDLNLRCINYADELYPVSRFVDGFRSLRPRHPELVIFAAITGVPEDLVTLASPTDTLDYPRLLADPRMQNHITTVGGTQILDPACSAPMRGNAAPAIRIAQVAQGFGANGIVQSICQSDFGPALDVITGRIGTVIIDAACPPHVSRDSLGTVPCEVLVDLPTGTPDCSGVPGASPVPESVDGSGVHCRIAQVAVDDGRAPPAGTEGWYYDDFSGLRPECGRAIAFTPGATPRTDQPARLVCACD